VFTALVVVGTCARGFSASNNTYSDIIYTDTPVTLKRGVGLDGINTTAPLQYFWEVSYQLFTQISVDCTRAAIKPPLNMDIADASNCAVVEYRSFFSSPIGWTSSPPLPLTLSSTTFNSRIPNGDASPGPPLFPGLPLGFLPYGPHHLPLHLHGRQTRAT